MGGLGGPNSRGISSAEACTVETNGDHAGEESNLGKSGDKTG